MSQAQSFKILRIDLHALEPEKAILHLVEEKGAEALQQAVQITYCIPILITKLQDLGLTVGGHLTIDINAEGK